MSDSSTQNAKPFYDRGDLPEGIEEQLGTPGSFPYTRGIAADGYRSKLWTMRQYAGFGTARETNERFRYLLAAGQTGLSTAFDLPTQMGYDSDHPKAAGEVGRVGVAIDTLADLETLLDKIDPGTVSTSMTINSTAAILLAMYVAVAKKKGVALDKLSGTIQNDILKEYVARGTYIFPPEPSLRIITDIFRYCKDHLPRWNTISISGYHIREAGSTAAEELAFTFANGIEYVKAALASGLDIDKFGGRLSFFFNVHNDLFEEVAKFRAARRMWASIMRNRFGAKDERSLKLRFHSQTAGSTLLAQEPENNIMRVTMQAFAAAAGGTQSLHTNAFDEALALPTERSSKLALRTQQVVAYESGVASVADPFGGSYYIEALTDRLETEANDLITEIDRMGGAAKAIEAGFMQKRIAESAYRYQRSIETKERTIVGLNAFTSGAQEEIPLQKIDPRLETEKVAELAAVKARRDNAAVSASLAKIKAAASGSANLMDPILEAVEGYATLGEITDVLRSVFGEYRGSTFV